MEQYKEFIKWFVDMAGENYKYEIETSTDNKLPNEVIDEIYRQLWVQYGINDIYLFSYYCDTCFKSNPSRSFHLDWKTILPPDAKLGSAWTKENIEENNKRWKHVQTCISGLQSKKNAVEIREAFSLLNLAERTKLGYECLPNIKIAKPVLDKIYALNHKELTERFNKLKDFIIEVDELKNGLDYVLTREVNN